MEKGKITLLYDTWQNVQGYMTYLAESSLQEHGTIVYLDCVDVFDQHYTEYEPSVQKYQRGNMYCIRAHSVSEILFWLKQADSFMQKQNVKMFFINSLTLPFQDHDDRFSLRKVQVMFHHINRLTHRFDLISVIGVSPEDNVGSETALTYLLGRARRDKLVVWRGKDKKNVIRGSG